MTYIIPFTSNITACFRRVKQQEACLWHAGDTKTGAIAMHPACVVIPGAKICRYRSSKRSTLLAVQLLQLAVKSPVYNCTSSQCFFGGLV